MGGHTGSYYLDDFVLTTAELSDLNLLKNPDFFDGEEAWTLTSLSAAVAEGAVANGEYAVSISNGRYQCLGYSPGAVRTAGGEWF